MTSCWKDEHDFWLSSFISLRGRPGTLHLVVDIEIYKEGEEDGEERDFPPWMFHEKDGKKGYLKGSDPVVSLALHERLYIRLCR